MRHQHNPRLGKGWIQIGLIRVEDKRVVDAAMKRHHIKHKVEENHYHKKGDPRQAAFKELFVARGYRREAMRVMKALFSSQPKEA